MDPREHLCHNQGCWAYGQRGLGNITIHSHVERRYRCERCGKTISTMRGTALAVPSRLWLGEALSTHRDRNLIRALLERVRACGLTQRVLLCVDGLRTYVSQARQVFREAVRTGGPGRPRLVLPAGILLAQVVKQYARRRVVGVAQRVVRGTAAAVRARLRATQVVAEAMINTAYIERLNAAFRARLAPLARRTRNAARQAAAIEAGI